MKYCSALKTAAVLICAALFFASAAQAAKVNIRIQSVIPSKADEVTMLKVFTDNVTSLTNGDVTFEILPAGAVVGVRETLEAVDKGLIEGGFAWTHYWSGLHPAATLFGSPTAGAGLGIDNIAWISWYMYGGGKEKGVIDAAEWCCPKPDSVFGFQKVLKHYYLQGLHQVVVNADLYINGDVWNRLTPHQKKAMEVAANASLMQAMAYRIHENGKALKDLTDNHGVILHDTPADYFPEYMNAVGNSMDKYKSENAFFKKVWDSMKAFADTAVPFWAGAQATNANLGKAYADQLKK